LQPTSFAKELIEERKVPARLVENRCSDRYTKSTPDVSVADLIR
jgi:hypothetical protein